MGNGHSDRFGAPLKPVIVSLYLTSPSMPIHMDYGTKEESLSLAKLIEIGSKLAFLKWGVAPLDPHQGGLPGPRRVSAPRRAFGPPFPKLSALQCQSHG